MAKTEETLKLERAIFFATQKTGVFSCFEVTIGFFGKERVDYMTYDTKGIWRCYEIKVSLSDFRSSAKKTFCGHYNYYVLTRELYELVKGEIPKNIGVYIGSFCAKPAKKQELLVEEKVLTDSFIRSLSREAAKVIRSNDVKTMQDLRKDYSRAIREAQHEHAENARIRYEMLIMKRFLKKIYGEDWEEIVHKEVNHEA